jgi:hypothetical protein
MIKKIFSEVDDPKYPFHKRRVRDGESGRNGMVGGD